MGESHVSVTEGSLTNIACGAWLLPTDWAYCISEHWRDAVPRLDSVVLASSDASFAGGAALAQPLDVWPAERTLEIFLDLLVALSTGRAIHTCWRKDMNQR